MTKIKHAILVIIIFTSIIKAFGNILPVNDTINVYFADTVLINLKSATGDISWQFSNNGTEFSDMEGANGKNIMLQAVNELVYIRAKVTLGDDAENCTWYSDTTIISASSIQLPYLTEIIEASPIEVEFNTPDSIALSKLQTQTQIIDSDNNAHQVDLNWYLPYYKQDSVGNYYIFGSFLLPLGVDPPIDTSLNSLQTETHIQVLEATPPNIYTNYPTAITISSALVGGSIESTGGYPIIESGIFWGTELNPLVSGQKLIMQSSNNQFIDTIKGLTPNTNYYVQAYAINQIDTTWGMQSSFKTLYDHGTDSIFTIYYNNPHNWDSLYVWIWNDSTTLSDSFPGELLNPLNKSSIWYEFDVPVQFDHMIFSNGHEGTQTPTLIRNYTGWYDGSTWNDTISEEMESIFYVVDIDGNNYNTVVIGNQIWMAENLKVTKYSNGDDIFYYDGFDVMDWANNSEGAYSWYDNDINWKDYYGALYNWYTIENEDDLCPNGWQVPQSQDINELINYATGVNENIVPQLMGCRMEDSPLGGDCNTTEHPRWYKYSENKFYGTDIYDFAGYPGGRITNTGVFSNGAGGHYAYFWTNTESNNGEADVFQFTSINSMWNDNLVYDRPKANGYSVRCIKSANQQAFIPNVTTNNGSRGPYAVTLNGVVNSDGGTTVTERGFYFGTENDPQLTGTKYKEQTGTGSFSLGINNLTPSTTYYYRTYATNLHGTATGFQNSIRTYPILDSIFFTDSIEFFYGTTYETINSTLVDSIKIIDTDSIFHNLEINWNVQSVDTINSGYYPIYGNFTLPDSVFKDYSKSQQVNIQRTIKINEPIYLDSIFEVPHVYVSRLTPYNTALNELTDTISVLGSDSNIYKFFVSWEIENYDSTLVDSFIAIGNFQLPIYIIHDDTTQSVEITTLIVTVDDVVVDVDGNVYQIIEAGNQTWLKENLRVTKSPEGVDLDYLDYEDSIFIEAYGKVYTWQDAERACPDGFHLPTLQEWQVLIDTLGGADVAGGKLKSLRTEPEEHPRWDAPNTDAENIYDFSAYPGGYLRDNGNDYDVGESGYWWTAEPYEYFRIDNNSASISSGNEFYKYFSIRCIKD